MGAASELVERVLNASRHIVTLFTRDVTVTFSLEFSVFTIMNADSYHQLAHNFPNSIVLPSGVELETTFTPAPFCHDGDNAESSSVKLAVCLHPWSRLGGNMNDPLLESLDRPLALEHGFHVLRYNARGVGRSSGSASLTGLPESEDLQALVQYAITKLGTVDELVLIGYSNGALTVSLHPPLALPARTTYVLISYPLGPRHFLTLFKSGTYQAALEHLLSDERARVLLVYGDQDQFTGAQAYEAWVADLRHVVDAEEGQGGREGGREEGWVARRVRFKCVSGGTHFWAGDAHRRLMYAIRSHAMLGVILVLICAGRRPANACVCLNLKNYNLLKHRPDFGRAKVASHAENACNAMLLNMNVVVG
ncbi:hypothetical protein EW146_g5118 [Bondarzewia mesenterica]|uniref:AB hydrolase-1 domain-containing protein n=1 Tax=Bondarzewia mesenterica TaxID=1095465 RepID=A0A4S4LTH7_9AGAM|nr:hypothetical protein EW146_g5118 [Bondarzewia mesenterica]